MVLKKLFGKRDTVFDRMSVEIRRLNAEQDWGRSVRNLLDNEVRAARQKLERAGIDPGDRPEWPEQPDIEVERERRPMRLRRGDDP